jgi:hypothetical protein
VDTTNGFLVDRSFLHDLDSLSAETVGETLVAGVATARAPPLADLNAHADQSVQTDQESRVKRMIVFGESPGAERLTSSSSDHHPAITIHRQLTLIFGCAPRRREGPSRGRKRLASTTGSPTRCTGSSDLVLPKAVERIPEHYGIRDGTVSSIRRVYRRPRRYRGSAEFSDSTVRSAEMIPVMWNYFDVSEQVDFGGTLLNPLLEEIAGHFSDTARDVAILDRLFDTERRLLQRSVIPSDFAVLVGRVRLAKGQM